MAELVSLEMVKKSLRLADYDGDGSILPNEDDDLLTAYLETAQEAVLRYLKSGADDTWTDATVPKAVQQSIIMAVQSMYDPDAYDIIAGLGAPDPKNPIVAMLAMLRRPTVA